MTPQERLVEAKVFFVRPKGEHWVFGCGDNAHFVFDSERRAVDFALGVICYRNGGELLILDANGNVVKRMRPGGD